MEKIRAYLTYWGGDTANATHCVEGYVFGHPTIRNATWIVSDPIIKYESHGHLGGGFAETSDTRYELGPTGYYGVEQLILNKGYKNANKI